MCLVAGICIIIKKYQSISSPSFYKPIDVWLYIQLLDWGTKKNCGTFSKNNK